MSIEQSDVVDFIGIDKSTGDITLAISDHLDWSDETAHLVLLQDKINTYLRFVESGEINEAYPQGQGLKIVIEVVGRYDLSEPARKFLQQAKEIVENAEIGLRFRRLQGQE